jgi:cytochrome c oxidase subunit 2
MTGAMGVGIPHDASLDGHRVDGIFDYITVATGICFLVMVVILLVATLFHRAGRRGGALYTHGDNRTGYLLSLLAASVIFFGIDLVALRRSARDLRQHFWSFPDADPGALRIEVTAQQWAWTFRYSGADGRFNTRDDIVTLNELHVPVAVPIYLKLRSQDVVHSFYLPNFRTKIDAVPGTTTRLWFQAQQPGRFEIGCAQHCGVSHYKMRGLLTATAPGEFQRWAARAAEDSAAREQTGDKPAGVVDGWDWDS